MGARIAAATAVACVGTLILACSGKTAGTGPDSGTGSSGSSSGSASGSGSGGSSGGVSSSGSGSGSGSGASSSSGSGGSSGSSSGSTGACMQCGAVCVYPECGGGCVSAPPATAVRSVSLSFSGVSIDGGTPNGWQTIGYNVDGKCTSSASTDVCTLQPGASRSTQVDGAGGIDNSYGENICPIMASFSSTDTCSNLSNVYLITDATGSGTMAIPTGNNWLEFPVRDAFVSQSASGGVLAAVAPAAGVVNALQATAGQISVSLCSGSAFQSIATQIEQTSDILSSGSSDPGSECDSISIGMTYTGSAPFAGPLPPVNNPCVMDAGTD